MTLDELKAKIDRINALLADPQPGLITWSVMLGDAIESLVWAWLGADKAPPMNTRALVARLIAGGEQAAEDVTMVCHDWAQDHAEGAYRETAARLRALAGEL